MCIQPPLFARENTRSRL